MKTVVNPTLNKLFMTFMMIMGCSTMVARKSLVKAFQLNPARRSLTSSKILSSFQPSTTTSESFFPARQNPIRLYSSRGGDSDGNVGVDEYGRKIRQGSRAAFDNDDNDDSWGAPPQPSSSSRRSSGRSSGGWGDDDDDDWGSSPSTSRRGGGGSRGGWDDDNDDWGSGGGGGMSSRNSRGRSSSRDGGSRGGRSRGGNVGGGWDDFDPWDDDDSGPAPSRRRQSSAPSRSRQSSRGGGRGDDRFSRGDRGGGGDRGRFGDRRGGDRRGGDRRGGDRRGGDRRNNSPYNSRDNSRRPGRQGNSNKGGTDKSRSINMNALEGAGYVHLYGLSSILNALKANRRDFVTAQEKNEALLYGNDDNEEEENDFSLDNDSFESSSTASFSSSTPREPPKPQAQFRPYLFVQEQRASGRRGQKASSAEQVMALAEERDIPVEYVDKGILNTLSGNRPHQGFVLRCGKLYFESLSRIPVPSKEDPKSAPSLWLVLDEVVDPQNLGALLRSAYFLGYGNLNVLVCAKNSAPPSPVVSAASAGALEVTTVYSTNNLPRALNQAKEDGFRIVGATVPTTSSSNNSNDEDNSDTPKLYDLQDLPTCNDMDQKPVLLVLGSEGHGLRTLVTKACTEFVRIPPGMGPPGVDDDSEDGGNGVDSLNVSVTGGILLWHLLNGK